MLEQNKCQKTVKYTGISWIAYTIEKANAFENRMNPTNKKCWVLHMFPRAVIPRGWWWNVGVAEGTMTLCAKSLWICSRNKTVDLLCSREDRPLGFSTGVSQTENGHFISFFIVFGGYLGTLPSDVFDVKSRRKLKELIYCRSAGAQTSPSLAISEEPSKRRLEIAFNL